jgi:predicted enzyme related to lactoylglutathione lyase
MTNKENTLNWFEISVDDINRAQKFYETIFGIKMDQQEMRGAKMAYFPMETGSGKASGALVQSATHKPSADGAKIYLSGNPDLADALSKIEQAGGKITEPKTQIGEFGFTAFFTDTEGNSVALHSNH